jgi:hypothetical protein
MRRGDGAEQRADALLARLLTELTILQPSMSRHDAEGFVQTPAGHSVAVTNPEFLGNSDVLEEMLDMCPIAQINSQGRVGHPLAIEVEPRSSATAEETEAGEHDR